MKNLFSFPIFVLLLIFCFSSCEKEDSKSPINGDNNEVKEISLTAKQQSIVKSGNSFAFELLKSVVESEQESKNIMISPLSINLALAMTANGAKNLTLEQMLQVMGFENFDMQDFNAYFKFIISELLSLDSQVDLSIANSIWYHEDFSVLQPFLDVNQQYYNSKISELDFRSPSAVDIINDWVEDATNQKITDLIDEIGDDVVMYLINAIYFYGNWKYEFDPANTSDMNFQLSNGANVQVPTMHMESDIRHFSDGSIQLVELPYGRGNFVMNLILPAYNQCVNELVSGLTAEKLKSWTSGISEKEMVLYLPKFKFEYEKQLHDILAAMGMPDLFNRYEADLSGINADVQLFVSRVLHKTYIDVNEEGTEAAAATAVEIEVESMPPSVSFSRPFVFIIREVSTDVVLFSGVVANPEQE